MADHDLDSLLRSLPLSSTEEKFLNIPAEELSEGLDMCKRSLIGKFLAPEEVIVQDLKSEIVVAWESDFSIINLRKNVYQFIRSLIGKFLAPEEVIVQGLKSEIVVAWESEFKIINLRKNVYQFVFASEDKLNQIMEDGPWCFDGNLLVLRKWRDDWESCKSFFDEDEFWVHIVGLPPKYCIASVGKRLISMFQGCKKAEIREEEVSGKRFFRLRIQVKILEPFRRVVLLSSDDGKSCIRGLIQYERLPNLCYACGLCDHTMDICSVSKGGSSVSETQELAFGPWLNADRKSSLLEELYINEVQPKVVEFENKKMNESDFVEGLQPLVEGQPKNAAANAVNQTAESKSFVWKIGHFSQLNVEELYSDDFVVGGYKWRVVIFPKGYKVRFLSVFLDVPDKASLPNGWSQYAQFSFKLVHLDNDSKSTLIKGNRIFSQEAGSWGFTSFIPLSELNDPGKGFRVNDTIVVEVDINVPKVLDSKKETGCNKNKNMNESDFVEGLQPLVEGQPKNAAANAENQTAESKAFVWAIHHFSKLTVERLYSDVFVVGGYKWRVIIYPKGYNVGFLSVFLEVPDEASLPDGWSQYAQFSFKLVDLDNSSKSTLLNGNRIFNQKVSCCGFKSFIPLSELNDPGEGFLVNDTIVVEVDINVPKVLDSKKETGCNNKENP